MDDVIYPTRFVRARYTTWSVAIVCVVLIIMLFGGREGECTKLVTLSYVSHLHNLFNHATPDFDAIQTDFEENWQILISHVWRFCKERRGCWF